MNECLEELKIFFGECLAKAGFQPEGIKIRDDGQALTVDLTIGDAGLLIGEDGKHISAWEHLLRIAAEKICKRKARVALDINHYRAMKDEGLRDIARKAAREAVLRKKNVELRPMNAYERRVIHSELALRPDVITESVGEEPERRVIISPL